MAKLKLAEVKEVDFGSFKANFHLYRCTNCLTEYGCRDTETIDIARCVECGEEFEKDG